MRGRCGWTALVVILCLLASCGFPAPVIADGGGSGDGSASVALTSFVFLAANNPQLSGDVAGTVAGTAVSVSLPRWSNTSSLVATFTTDAAGVSVDGVEQISGSSSNDFSRPVTYRLSDARGRTTDVAITVDAPSLSQSSELAVAPRPTAVRIADLNNDTRPDLVVCSIGANMVGEVGVLSVLLNTTAQGGTGPTFAARVDFVAPDGLPFDDVVVADMNQDGKPDLVGFGAGLSVFLNTMTTGAQVPSFGTRQDFTSIGGSGNSLVAADLNGDSKSDIATVDYSGNQLIVLLNSTVQGSNTVQFRTPANFATGVVPNSGTSVDMNRDGKPDLAAANYGNGAQAGANSVSVLLDTTAANATTPTFATGVKLPTDGGPLVIASGDLNVDGAPDLATANIVGDVSLLLNATPINGTVATFKPENEVLSGSNGGVNAVAIDDLDGDGTPDVAATMQLSNELVVLRNTTLHGSFLPTFQPARNFRVGTNPNSLAIGDLDSDGRLDVVVTNRYNDLAATVSILVGR